MDARTCSKDSSIVDNGKKTWLYKTGDTNATNLKNKPAIQPTEASSISDVPQAWDWIEKGRHV